MYGWKLIFFFLQSTQRRHSTVKNKQSLCPRGPINLGGVAPGGGGVLLGILGGGVPPGSSNPDPISDQKM